MQTIVENWFRQNKRDLPWRHNRHPYRVWLAEIMLQQTQVTTVIDYFNRFTDRFKTVQDLADAPEDEVMALWSGLGYYSRCRSLHKTAKKIVSEHQGEFPDTYEELLQLPGVGSYTAGAILAFAFNKAGPVVDGNIARVLSRLYNDDTEINSTQGKKHFESISLALAQKADCVSDWQEGLMELGATVCKPTNPSCDQCPLQALCTAYRLDLVETLPKKIQKQARKSMDVVLVLLQDDKHIWLEKNKEARLFKGLYSPPHQTISHADEIPQVLTQLLNARQMKTPKHLPEPLVVRRTLTHRDLTLYGYAIHVNPQKHPSPHWVLQSQLPNMALSAAVRALFSHAMLSNQQPKLL